MRRTRAAFSPIMRRFARTQTHTHHPQELFDEKLVRHIASRRLPNIGQLRYITRIVSGTERNRLALSGIIFFLALVLYTGRVYLRTTIAMPAPGGSYTEGLIGNPRFINPLLASEGDIDRDIAALIFAGLFRADGTGTIVPDLASQFKVNAERTEYTIELREHIQFHDGEPLTADDVLFTFQLMQNADLKSPLRSLASGMTMTKLDNRTIVLTLKESAPDTPIMLTIGILPQHLWDTVPAALAHRSDANVKPVGAGPYQFKKLTRDGSGTLHSMTLVKSDTYQGQKPLINEITFKFYPDFETALEALKNKNVEGLGFLPLQYQQDLSDISWLTIHSLDLPQYRALFFNPVKNEALKDRAVRRAIAHAIDRDAIVTQALQGNAVAIVSPLLPALTPTSTVADLAGYNPSETARLLDEARWKITDGSSLRKKEAAELALTITTVDQPEHRAVASIIQSNLAAVGFSIKVSYVSKANIRKSVIEPRNYEILLFGQITTGPNDLYAFWHSSQTQHPGNNLSLLANKDVDVAVNGIRDAGDTTEAQKHFEELTHKLAAEGFAAFLYTPMYLYPVHQKIKGIEKLQNVSTPADRFATLSHWYIKTKRQKP